MSSTHRSKIRYLKVFAQKQQEITKEVVEFHVLLTRSLSGGGILRRSWFESIRGTLLI